MEKKGRRDLVTVVTIVVMTMALTFALISCGGDGGERTAGSIKGETVLETNENGETVIVATDEDGETVIYETDKSGKIKESQKGKTSAKAAGEMKKSADSEKTKQTTKTAANTSKATTAATTAATTQSQVCYISIDGYCSGKAISIQGGDTAYSILTRSGASVSGSGSYVRGINGRFEFDEGPQSGWKYSVNGYTPNVGAGSYSVKAGDSISWYYVTSY